MARRGAGRRGRHFAAVAGSCRVHVVYYPYRWYGTVLASIRFL